jgi:high-affinity nickel-transport protein
MAIDNPPQQMKTMDMLRVSFAGLNQAERRRVTGMYGSILFLHALGFFVLIAFVVPAHYKGLGIGVSTLAYTLGLRHAFDADHISAIENTT